MHIGGVVFWLALLAFFLWLGKKKEIPALIHNCIMTPLVIPLGRVRGVLGRLGVGSPCREVARKPVRGEAREFF